MKRPHVWAWLTCLGLFASACTANEPAPLTEVVIEIYADQLVQRAGDMLIVEFLSGPRGAAELSPSDPERFDLSASSFRWPVTITLVAKPSHENHIFELNLRLEKSGVVLTRGRVQSSFVKGKTLVLQTSLGAECLGMLDCGENETCVVSNGQATCKSASVDPGKLPDVGNAPKSNDGGTAPLDAGKQLDAGQLRDAGQHDAGAQRDGSALDAAGSDANGCSPSLEVCDNGQDDDCNGAVDCADEACKPVTQCVPDPLAFVLVAPEEDCPGGYEPLDIVHEDLKDLGCSGCACEPLAKQCETYVNIYQSLLACQGDRENTGGVTLPEPTTSTCSTPVGKQLDLPNGGFGFNVHVKAGRDECKAWGDPKLAAAEWGVTRRRCSSPLRQAGCSLGSFCAQKIEARELCWTQGDAGCTDLAVARTYYSGYDDTRACEPCGCTAQGGSCEDIGATLTTELTCRAGGTNLRNGQKSCETITQDAMVRGTGVPRDPVCTSASVVSGSLLPVGATHLCCGG